MEEIILRFRDSMEDAYNVLYVHRVQTARDRYERVVEK